MQFVAEVSGKGQDVDRVKEQLLQSNPVLEGNVVFLHGQSCKSFKITSHTICAIEVYQSKFGYWN